MTHESILALVDAVNSGTAFNRIFLRPLTVEVDFAWVWEGEPTGTSSDEGSYSFYFVRDTNGHCIGAIDDLGGDIHAVMKAEHRRRGVMSRLMRTVVLPHIFTRGRTVQPTQFSSYEGRALALKLGFRMTGSDRAELRADQVSKWTYPPIGLESLSALRAEAVIGRIRTAAQCLRDVRARLKDRATASIYDELGSGAYSIDHLIGETVEPDYSETAPPSLPAHDPVEQGDIEKLIYRSAACLRMAADELDSRDNPERVVDIRKLARCLIESSQKVRDDWQDLQFRQSIAARST